MPFVNVHMLAGRTVEQKRALLRAITDAMVQHAGAGPDHLHVTVQEYELDNWARGGVLVSDLEHHDKKDDGAAADDPERGHPDGTGDVHHLLLESTDVDAMVAFYTAVVGVTVRDETTHRDGRRLVRTNNGIAFTSATGGGRNLDHFAFPVGSVASAIQRAERFGAPIVRGPGSGPYGYTVYFADPDGNEVELFEPAG